MPLTSTDLNKSLNKARGLSTPAAQSSAGNGLRYLLLGCLAILVISGIGKMFLQARQQPATIQVVAAGQDIQAGCKIGFGSLHYLEIPRKYATRSMLVSYEQLVGKITRTGISKGSPILKSDISQASSVSETLRPDQRAITLRLDPELQVDHALVPGDKVDVLVTCASRSNKSNNQKYTKTVCQNLTVLLCTTREFASTGSSHNGSANRVTLAASSQDCERLSQASDTGKIRLVLRNPMSANEMQLPGADERDLIPSYALKEMAEAAFRKEEAQHKPSAGFFGFPAPQAALPPPPPVASIVNNDDAAQTKQPDPLRWVVQMFMGSKREEYAVPSN